MRENERERKAQRNEVTGTVEQVDRGVIRDKCKEKNQVLYECACTYIEKKRSMFG